MNEDTHTNNHNSYELCNTNNRQISFLRNLIFEIQVIFSLILYTKDNFFDYLQAISKLKPSGNIYIVYFLTCIIPTSCL